MRTSGPSIGKKLPEVWKRRKVMKVEGVALSDSWEMRISRNQDPSPGDMSRGALKLMLQMLRMIKLWEWAGERSPTMVISSSVKSAVMVVSLSGTVGGDADIAKSEK